VRAPLTIYPLLDPAAQFHPLMPKKLFSDERPVPPEHRPLEKLSRSACNLSWSNSRVPDQRVRHQAMKAVAPHTSPITASTGWGAAQIWQVLLRGDMAAPRPTLPRPTQQLARITEPASIPSATVQLRRANPATSSAIVGAGRSLFRPAIKLVNHDSPPPCCTRRVQWGGEMLTSRLTGR